MAFIKFLTLLSTFSLSVCLECGEFTNINNMLTERIVNGVQASVGEFPWQVSIQRSTGIRIPFARQWLPGPATWPPHGSWQLPVLQTVQARPTPTPPGGWAKPPTNRPVPYPPGANHWSSSTARPHLPTGAPPPMPSPIPHPAPQPQPQPHPQPSPSSGRWQHFCGGSIISENWILTAAHCVESVRNSYTPGSIRIVLGTTDWRTANNGNPQIIAISKVVVHDRWDRGTGQNDIALLQTQTPIQFHTTTDGVIAVNKVCLSKDSTSEYSGIALSSGWGYLNKNSRVSPDILRKVDLPVVDFRTCHNAFNRVIEVTQNQVCAGQAPKGNCMGDSGGPLVQVTGNKATQIGIVSFSIPCAVHGYPDVFTKVSKYLSWISQHSGNAIGTLSMG